MRKLFYTEYTKIKCLKKYISFVNMYDCLLLRQKNNLKFCINFLFFTYFSLCKYKQKCLDS